MTSVWLTFLTFDPLVAKILLIILQLFPLTDLLVFPAMVVAVEGIIFVCMATFNHFYMGFEIKVVLDLFCYQTEFPHMLTSTQKLTRLYRCMMRREKEYNFHQTKIDPQDYLKGLLICRNMIEAIWDKPESSPEWNKTIEYFRDRIRSRMDPNMNVIDCKPYSMAQGRYYVWSDEELSFDPYGYYANNRIIGEKKPDYGFFYYPAFPQDAIVHVFQPPTEYNDVPDVDPFKQ